MCACPPQFASIQADRASAVCIDWQSIRLQQTPELLAQTQSEDERRKASLLSRDNESDIDSVMPRFIECELTADLVDTCIPGDVINLSGVVSTAPADGSRGAGRGSGGELNIYIHVNHIDTVQRSERGKLAVTFTSADIESLTALIDSTRPQHLFSRLVHSLCPRIYGHELVKAALILSLFGGTSRAVAAAASSEQSQPHQSSYSVTPSSINLPTLRTNAHILLVGDPGLGKSQLLRAVARVSPRGVYVSGHSSSKSGLTVTLHRERPSGGGQSGSAFALEAGALVLSDSGTCCIDEMDKMAKTEQSALLEAMEQQQCTIAKGGIVTTLPARTTVVAAANPHGGHYDFGKSVAENIRLPPPLLSRFDLVFILVDKPNPLRDALLSAHVIKRNSAMTSGSDDLKHTSKRSRYAGHLTNAFDAADTDDDDSSLLDRLHVHVSDTGGVVSTELLRLYITYARRYCHPSLSADARSALETFYLQLRGNVWNDGTPMTTRQLEAMIRLTTARARAELRTEATARDARDVIELVNCSLADVYRTDTPANTASSIDSSRKGGVSMEKQVRALLSALTRRSRASAQTQFHRSEIREIAQTNNIITHDTKHTLEDILQRMNQHGFILLKAQHMYQLATAE